MNDLHRSEWIERERDRQIDDRQKDRHGAAKVEAGTPPAAPSYSSCPQPNAGPSDLDQVDFLQQDLKSRSISAGGSLVSCPLFR